MVFWGGMSGKFVEFSRWNLIRLVIPPGNMTPSSSLPF